MVKAEESRLTVRNKAAWRVACRLYDLGFMKTKPNLPGNQMYPKAAVKKFQKSMGWEQAHGKFSPATQRRLFGKIKP